MKTMKITENTIERINKVTEELIEEAREIISNIAKPENCLTISKEESNEIIQNTMEAIDKLIRDYNLTNAKVNVWNRSESNPNMIDKEFIEVLHEYYKDSYFDIKKKTRYDQLINRIYRLIDEVKVLISNANRIAEMEGVEDTNESTRYEENKEDNNMTTMEEIKRLRDEAEAFSINMEEIALNGKLDATQAYYKLNKLTAEIEKVLDKNEDFFDITLGDKYSIVLHTTAMTYVHRTEDPKTFRTYAHRIAQVFINAISKAHATERENIDKTMEALKEEENRIMQKIANDKELTLAEQLLIESRMHKSINQIKQEIIDNYAAELAKEALKEMRW